MPDLDYLVEYFGIERINVVNSQEAIYELIDLLSIDLLTPEYTDKLNNMRYVVVLMILSSCTNDISKEKFQKVKDFIKKVIIIVLCHI